jgi:hypothetical protein
LSVGLGQFLGGSKREQLQVGVGRAGEANGQAWFMYQFPSFPVSYFFTHFPKYIKGFAYKK